MPFLKLPNVLSAYPYYYDYLHSIHLKFRRIVKIVDGAGQVLNSLARGKYQLHVIDGMNAELEFQELAEYSPYRKEEKLRDLAPFSVRVRKEEGLFPFANEVVWRIPNKDEWPCRLYRVRYVFEYDPLTFGDERAKENLYNMFESNDLINETHLYYAKSDAQHLTKKELVELGVPLELFWTR